MKAGGGEHRTGPSNRTVSLHADDFGMNGAVNAGILAGFRRGLLTGTSLMANGPVAEAAARDWTSLERERASGALPSAEARRRLGEPDRPFDLGLHLNLTQGAPLSDDYPAALRGPDGTFCGVWRLALRLARSGSRHLGAIEREISAQLARVQEFGVAVDRVDGHQYVEMLPTVAAALRSQLPRYGLNHVRMACEPQLARTTLGDCRPVAWLLARIKRSFGLRYRRAMEAAGFIGPPHFFGTAHAGRVTLDKLRQFVRATRDGESAEIGMHPAERVVADRATAARPNDPWFDPLAELRPRELAMLVDPDLVEESSKLGIRLGRVASAGATP